MIEHPAFGTVTLDRDGKPIASTTKLCNAGRLLPDAFIALAVAHAKSHPFTGMDYTLSAVFHADRLVRVDVLYVAAKAVDAAPGK